MARLKIKELQYLRIALAIMAAGLLTVGILIIRREVIRSNAIKNLSKNLIETQAQGTEPLIGVDEVDTNGVRTKQQKREEKVDKERDFIWDFYEHILQINTEDWDITKYISKSLAKRIWTDDYDGCYQVWLFRTGAQDGEGASQILSITPTKEGWYEVKYLDMGLEGKTSVHMSNGVIDDFKTTEPQFEFV